MMTPTVSRARSRTRARESAANDCGEFSSVGDARESRESLARDARETRVMNDDDSDSRGSRVGTTVTPNVTRARAMTTTGTFLRALALLANLVRRAQSARAPPADALAPLAVRATGGDAAEERVRACRRACASEAFAPTCARTIGTFANACWANCAFAKGLFGVTGRANEVLASGECDDDGETRFRNPDYACASACVALYAPVCGENGITYANECLALCSNVRSIDGACHEGRW